MPEELLPNLKKQKRDKGSIVRSELNLERSSIFTVSTYRKKSREIVIREKGENGEKIEYRVIVGKTAGGAETGVLDVHHFKVYLVLLELWEKAGKPINEPVHFTIWKIIKRLGLIFGGDTYRRVKRWLRELHEIPITFINSFFLPKEGLYRTLDPLHILSYLSIREQKVKDKADQLTYGYGEFQFDRHLLESLINNYTHPLRLDVVREFKKHKDLAILLYVYLDRCLAFKEKYEVMLETLFEHLDLSQKQVRYPADRKIKIEPVLKELEGKPLSSGILSYCRVHKTEDSRDYKLVARKTPYQTLPHSFKTLPQIEPGKKRQSGELRNQLLSKGLTEDQIREIFNLWDDETITKQLEIFPFKLGWYQSKGLAVKNPTALLYMMLRGNWDPPPNYLEAKARQERAKKEMQEREERAKREERARRSAEQKHQILLAFYQSLSKEEQRAIDEQAFANLQNNEFLKTRIQMLKVQGEDPLTRPMIKYCFEAERDKILESLHPFKGEKEA